MDRYILRNEYFGGILHDLKDMKVDILDKDEYKFMTDLNSTREREDAIRSGNGLIDKLKKTGGIDEDGYPIGIRYVKHPIELPEGTLASPLRVYDTFGHGCNLPCKGCLNASSADRKNENRASIEDTVKVMKKFYDAGTMEWRFTGGEPTIYGDLMDAVNAAQDLGMATMLNSNGCWEDSQYETFLNAGFNEIIISIEGPEVVNDEIRAEGVYKKVIKTLDEIKSYNNKHPDDKIRVTLNQTISKDSASSVDFVVNLAADYGYNVNFVPLRPYGRAGLDNMLTTKEFMDFSENVQRLRETPKVKESEMKIIHKNMDLFNYDLSDKSGLPFPFNYSTCGALATGFGLSPNRKTNACSFLAKHPLFEGKDLKIDEITVYDAWLDPKMEKIRKAKRIGCEKCNYYMQQCEGKCVAMALGEGGKLKDRKVLGKDRYCYASKMKK